MAAAFTGWASAVQPVLRTAGFEELRKVAPVCACDGRATNEPSRGARRFIPSSKTLAAAWIANFNFVFLKNFSWRLQFDYMHSHSLTATQNDFRGTAGLVWRF